MWKENKFWIEDLLGILDQPSDTPILVRQGCYTHPNILQNKAHPQPFTTATPKHFCPRVVFTLLEAVFVPTSLFTKWSICFHSFLAKLRHINHVHPIRGISYLGSFIWVWPFPMCNSKIWRNRSLYHCAAILSPVDSPAHLLQPGCVKPGLSRP